MGQVFESQGLVQQEEGNYMRAAGFIDSVRREILASQGHVGESRRSYLARAYRSLPEGDYSSAVEWAKMARSEQDPRHVSLEASQDETDRTLCHTLWQASHALLGIVVAFTLLRVSTTRQASLSQQQTTAVRSTHVRTVVDHTLSE